MPQCEDNTHLTPEAHLERDWELFQRIESGASTNLCRTWVTRSPVVVIGRSALVADHVVREACDEDAVPILRRFSGGGSVVLGPGCLNYAVGVTLVSRPELIDVAASFRMILGRIVDALGVEGLAIGGGTDLVLNGRKVSGNAQRRGRRALLHHGTILCGFDARLAARYLTEPRRQPAYRRARTHVEFLGNLPRSQGEVREAVIRALGAASDTTHLLWPDS